VHKSGLQGFDCVVIYKADRLSRSLFDFTRLMRIFDQHGVSFVSVTQQFNSSTPMGRLTLNILLSFAEFERQIISERTRDKIAAARRKGKWMGGYPVLGYDADASRTRLVVNEAEAKHVREIFAVFVRHGSLIPALEEIHHRGWRLKSWTTRKGAHHAGQPFDRPSLVRLLSNVLYLGQVNYQGKVYPGEQPGIVDRQLWKKANERLQRPERGGDSGERNRQGALLKNLLLCAGCGQGMVAGYSTKRGRRYRYYVCLRAQKRGARACPGKLVGAERIEKAVVDALYREAHQPHGEPLRQVLPLDLGCWAALQRNEQHRRLTTVVKQILYDRRLQQGQMRLQEELGGTAGQEVMIHAGRPHSAREMAQEFGVSAQVIAGILGAAQRRLAREGLTSSDLREAARCESELRHSPRRLMESRNEFKRDRHWHRRS
jgi:hypothetical protein